ncbi:MAG: ERCC4 domain-containing protein [Anaerolineae bacterium]
MPARSVIVDSREPEWCQNFRLSGVSVRVQELPAGDAWVICDDATLVVERKTLHDLCGSISDGRLFNQVAEMRAASEWAYVVVTGVPTITAGKLTIDGRVSNWKWSSVQGALLTVQELGASVVWCESDSGYASTLASLARRDRHDVRVKARRQAVMESPAETLLTSIPGVGASRVGALLEQCGTAAWALDFLTGDGGGDVPGVGKSTKQAARYALGLESGYRLAVIYEEEESDA